MAPESWLLSATSQSGHFEWPDAPMSPKPPDGPDAPWTAHSPSSDSHHDLGTAVPPGAAGGWAVVVVMTQSLGYHFSCQRYHPPAISLPGAGQGLGPRRLFHRREARGITQEQLEPFGNRFGRTNRDKKTIDAVFDQVAPACVRGNQARRGA